MINYIKLRFAGVNDTRNIIEFIKNNWSRNHIFSKFPKILKWQHNSFSKPRRLNFVIAENFFENKNPIIIGILGYIQFSRFTLDKKSKEISLAIWKTKENSPTGLGLNLLKFLKSKLNPEMVLAIGTSLMVNPIYKVIGYNTGFLSHYALFPLKKKSKKDKIKNIPINARLLIRKNNELILKKINKKNILKIFSLKLINNLGKIRQPKKNFNYILNRFFHHPVYKYEVRAVIFKNKLKAFFIWRKVKCPKYSILTIVDIIGNVEVIANCGFFLREEIINTNCEYMDLMQYGIEPKILKKSGFISKNYHKKIILPSHFEPFQNKNIKTDIVFWINSGNLNKNHIFFKADSDQDRPNKLKKSQIKK